MDTIYKNMTLNSHLKSSSASNMMASPFSTNTPQTCHSILQFLPFIQSSVNKQEMKKIIMKERREYDKRKTIVECGLLTQRGMNKYLKPNRFKWQKNELKLCDTLIQYNIFYYSKSQKIFKFIFSWHFLYIRKNYNPIYSIIETKLKIADLIMNSKGGQSRKELLIEKIQKQIESPRQTISTRTIKSEHNVQLFMDRIKSQTIPLKLRQNAQSPSKINQSQQKIIQNFTTTYQTE